MENLERSVRKYRELAEIEIGDEKTFQRAQQLREAFAAWVRMGTPRYVPRGEIS
jgi:hypothetical protein